MITIVDYGAGNISSLKNAFVSLGEEVELTADPDKIQNAQKLVLPGQGSFGFMMETLEKKSLVEPIKNALQKGTPYLGVCLGMQVLFGTSSESPGTKGLDLLDGKVVKFSSGKIPQLGWNKVDPKDPLSPGYAYFANSYKVNCDPENIFATTDYGGNFPSMIRKDNLLGTQFHPEKSGIWGLNLLRWWLQC